MGPYKTGDDIVITLSRNQKLHVSVNGGACVVGDTALAFNGLMWGNSCMYLQTFFERLNNIQLCDIKLQYYHFDDDAYLVRHNDNVYLPTAERAIVDTIKYIEVNYNEGSLIESLQTYISHNSSFTKLYEVADHYGVPRSDVDYWLNEAREESDMSMG